MEGEKFTHFARKYIPGQHTLPLLLVEQLASSDTEDKVFRTVQSSKAAIMLVKEGRKLGGRPLDNAVVYDFHLFEKSMRTGISVGRTTNNKICLPDNSISKMHASLKFTVEDRWTVVDVESENGTRVNGKPIEQKKPVVLANGDGITLGDTFHCTFFLPDGFKAYLDSLHL